MEDVPICTHIYCSTGYCEKINRSLVTSQEILGRQGSYPGAKLMIVTKEDTPCHSSNLNRNTCSHVRVHPHANCLRHNLMAFKTAYRADSLLYKLLNPAHTVRLPPIETELEGVAWPLCAASGLTATGGSAMGASALAAAC